jgi:hypothetical protein
VTGSNFPRSEFGLLSGFVKGDLISLDLDVINGRADRVLLDQRIVFTVLGPFRPPKMVYEGDHRGGTLEVWNHLLNENESWQIHWWVHKSGHGNRLAIDFYSQRFQKWLGITFVYDDLADRFTRIAP